MSPGLHPICAHDGRITCQHISGNIKQEYAQTYEYKAAQGGSPLERFKQNLALLRLKEAWDAALQLDARPYWLALAGKALENMDIHMAIRVYRQLGDPGMVMGLERISHVEDKNLLAGHILLIFAQHQGAQDLFLSSSRPVTALEMQRDLLHWDQALKLAHTLAPAQVPELSVEYAQQLEFKGEHESALKMFESALNSVDADGRTPLCTEAQQTTCMAGIARCTLRLGDLRRGINYVREAKDQQLCRDCAAILEGMNQFSEAASLYEEGNLYEKAAAIYIRKLNFTQAAAIMHKVTLPKLHAQYAKACETANKFEEAAKAYENARDMDSVVRLYLDKLAIPEKAFDIVRTTASSNGAQLVAHFCQEQGDFRGAIEFLLMAKRSEEAFNLAKLHGQMEMYARVQGDFRGAIEFLLMAKR